MIQITRNWLKKLFVSYLLKKETNKHKNKIKQTSLIIEIGVHSWLQIYLINIPPNKRSRDEERATSEKE